jgi:hypothetical protein
MPESFSFARARWLLWFSLLLLVVLLAGCDRDSVLKLIGYDRARLLRMTVSEKDETFARNYIENVRQRRFEQVENDLDPSATKSEAQDNLRQMAAVFPPREPASTKLVAARVIHHADSSITSSLDFEYGFAPAAQPTSATTELIPEEWLLAEVVVQTAGSKRTVELLTFTPIPEPLEKVNAFTLSDKGISQYAALGLTIFVSLFSLDTFVLCLQTKMGKKKWVWLILIVIGVFRFTANWTTGQWFYTPLAVQAPPVTWSCMPYGPWMVQITIPLGAIAFLLWRKKSSPPQSPTLG